MSWFSAKILYESKIEGHMDPEPLYEESIRIFNAPGEAEAIERATEVGLRGEHSYHNEAKELVSWRFTQVLEVQNLCEEELRDGMEVFSNIFSKE